MKTLDTKLERILADPSCDDFLLADAKDADMAFGMASPGADSPGVAAAGCFKTLEQLSRADPRERQTRLARHYADERQHK